MESATWLLLSSLFTTTKTGLLLLRRRVAISSSRSVMPVVTSTINKITEASSIAIGYIAAGVNKGKLVVKPFGHAVVPVACYAAKIVDNGFAGFG
jgi:hypothetical protein